MTYRCVVRDKNVCDVLGKKRGKIELSIVLIFVVYDEESNCEIHLLNLCLLSLFLLLWLVSNWDESSHTSQSENEIMIKGSNDKFGP